MRFAKFRRRMAACRLWCVLLPVVAGGPAARAQEPAPSFFPPEADPLVDTVKQLGPWEQQARLLHQAQENVFQRHGWNSEPDRFTLETARRISEIPPYDIMGRFDTGMAAVAGRYNLTAEQQSEIKQRAMIEMMTFMGRHGGEIMKMGTEVLRARVEQRPFTSEEVARWSKQVQPLLEDGLRVEERMLAELRPMLTPEQQRLLESDLAAADRRLANVREDLSRWERGEWSPEEWGMQHDPIQMGRGMEPGQQANSARGTGGEPESGAADAGSNDPLSEWERYVRDFCNLYRLDEEQRTAAHAILRDVQTQWSVQLAARERDGAAGRGSRGTRALSDNEKDLRDRLFEELKRRIDRIPDRHQRSAVGAVDGGATAPGPS